jgi:hypothetical protein
VLLWFRRGGHPAADEARIQPGGRTVWGPAVYSALLRLLANPIYGGAYAFGKTKARTSMVEGRARKTVGHKKPRSEWTVLIPDHHAGYISWEQYERNQAMMAANVHMKSRAEPKQAVAGRALLVACCCAAVRAHAAMLAIGSQNGAAIPVPGSPHARWRLAVHYVQRP